MSDLGPDDFVGFFEAVHGYRPFPWQARLLEQLTQSGSWPSLLDLPTGVGKTAVLDVAVFHLALEAGRGGRQAARRIVFVVDRRTIVDQAYARAMKIAEAIESAQVPVLKHVGKRLRALGGQGRALEVVALRGGMPRSDAWAKTPDRPVIAVSTVDQVGSRLLFRGFGVSDAMKPVHAGLLGQDVLWLLDEVHLSEPFRQTLEAVSQRYLGWAAVKLPAPFSLVEMSATPGRSPNREPFGLSDADRAHPTLSRRLDTKKPVSLVKEIRERSFVDTCTKQTTSLLEAGHRTVAVVLNRVRTAREVAAELRGRLPGTVEVRLLTGRMRPLDRADVERELVPRIGAGRKRSPTDVPMVVVATQCIEAGADFDFDALVTECASLDALRQRFGRLDRLGDYGKSCGVILGRNGDLSKDPVYGLALPTTLEWLAAQSELDFGVQQLQLPPPAELRTLVTPMQDAPLLLPMHLDSWAQTDPIPDPDPDLTLWLHGPQRGAPEVQLVWRADLSVGLLDGADDKATSRTRVIEALLNAVPPSSPEAMSLPLGAVRRWLHGLPEPDTSDVEGGQEEDESETKRPTPSRRWRAVALREQGPEIVEGDDLRPGDTLVVPTAYGGIEGGNWSPGSKHASDRAEEATLRQRGRAVLRLHPAVLEGVTLPVPVPGDDLDDALAVDAFLSTVGAGPAWLGETIRMLRAEPARRRRIIRIPFWDDADGAREAFVVLGRRVHIDPLDGATTEADEGSFTGTEIGLDEHLAGVGAVAKAFAQRLSLPGELASDLELAARWHDVGKADPRFQRLLHGGDQFKAEIATRLIAKSATVSSDRAARLRAARLSGYPRGARHEVMSVAMMQDAALLREQAHDWELVLHLVASHHGRCRPLAPVVRDESPVTVELDHEGLTVTASSAHGLERLDSGIGQRFWRLVRRYGWWGLAWLEAIVRLADHRRSEAEQRGGGS